MSESIEAYKIGVAFVADATKVTGPIGEMLQNMDRILQKQRDVNMGFTEMVSSLGGARRLAGGLASDMERAARAARDIARASAQSRGGGASGGGATAGGTGRRARAGVDQAAEAEEASSAASAPRIALLPPPARQITYDPNANSRTSTAGTPGNYLLGGPGVAVGAPYGGVSAGRPAPLLLPPPASTALTAIPGQGDSRGNGANFRQSGYNPNWSAGDGPIPVGRVPPMRTGEMYGPPAPYRGEGIGTAVGGALRMTGPYLAMAGVFGGAHGVHMAFRQGEEVGDTASMMAHAYGPNGRLWSDAQIRQAQDLALNAVRTVPGASYAGTLEMIARTSGITADAGEALSLAPSMARAGQIFAMRGAGPNAVQQVEAAIQSGEISGLNGPNGQLDVGKLGTFIDRLAQTSFAMQGTFDLPKYLTGLRQFGVGASGADMDFLTARLPSMMRVMQESRAGTALSSLDQLMLSPAPNTRNARYAIEQRRLGLRDAHGNVTNRDELIRDPAQWYYSTMVPAFSSHGITSRGDVIDELSRIFSRSTVQRLGASLSADTALYSREYQRNMSQQAQGNAPLADFLKNAPGAQFASFTESWRAFEAITSTAMMTPVVKSVQMITGALQDVTGFVKNHPDDVHVFAQDVQALVSVMTGVAKGIGAVYSFLPAPLRHIVGGAVTGAAGGAVAGSVLPGAGTIAGAATGAFLGAAGASITDAYNDAMRPTEVHTHVTLDGREIAHHVQTITTRQGQRSRRAQSGGPDSLATPQIPGAGWAH